jgi:hypothetical protein
LGGKRVVPASESTRPEDFSEVFRRQGVLVVGGHAVNLWASYYAPRGDSELAQFAPFVSKDGDVYLRDKELAVAVAAAAGWKFRNNPEARSPVLGHIYLVRSGRELTVDVLRAVRGLTDADLSATEEIRFVDGQAYLVPAPEVMLKAKLANLATIQQEDRPDLRHARIMIVCCRNYLIDACQAVLSQKITERDAVDRFMATLQVLRTAEAREMDRRHKLGLLTAIPARASLQGLTGLPRLLAFYDHQVQQKQGPWTAP